MYCQTTLFGTTSDNKNNPIPNSSIVLRNSNSNAIVEYCYSNEKGEYELVTNRKGVYVLSISALNYESTNIDIELTNETKLIKKDVVLIYKPIELNEVIINKERPVTIKKDTITFNAKSFIKGDEKVVEDLLKEIPGLTVTNDGTIKVGNQEVEKVMIEGDDFFENGYKLLTKNMPINPIEKIELYKHYSNNKLLKGIESSEKVALNLKLKDEAKRQWFGNMSVGYGLVSENRYELHSNLMNFGKKDKFYFLTNLNNTGDEATGDVNQLIRPYKSDDIATVGDNQSANAILNLSYEAPNLKEKRVNFNNTEMLSLNSIFKLSPKTKLKVLGFFNSDENDFFRNSFQSFIITNSNFENIENATGRKNKITSFEKFDLIYDVSKTQTFEYTGEFNITNERNRSNLAFNSDLLNEKLKSNNQLINQKAVFTNKFKNNNVLLFSGRYINEKTPQNYSVNQFIYQDLFNQNADNVFQQSENKMQFAGVDAHLLSRKKRGDLFEVQLGNQFRRDNLNSILQLKDNQTLTTPLGYKNNVVYNTNDLYFKTKYLIALKKFNIITQIELHQLYNGLQNENNSQRETPFYANPKLGFEWEINDKSRILASYSYNKANATITDVYDNYIQTGFRSFDKGIGKFNQLETSNVAANYTYGNWGDKIFVNTFLMFTKNYDFYSTNTLVSQNYSQSEKLLIRDKESLTFSSVIDKYFKPISSNLKLTLDGTKSNYKNIVNNSDLREVKNNSFNYGIELRSGFKGFFNYHVGTRCNYNEVKTTQSKSYTNNLTFLDLSFLINGKFNFQIQTERYFFGNLESNSNKYYFMDVETRYTVKENKLTFSISGNNLFNTQTFTNYSINDISISKTKYKLQQRYVLLKMEFRF